MTVITKALEQFLVIGQRSFWQPKSVLVTGAGPIGLLAALRLSVRDLPVHGLDRAETGPKPELVRALGASYHRAGFLIPSASRTSSLSGPVLAR